MHVQFELTDKESISKMLIFQKHRMALVACLDRLYKSGSHINTLIMHHPPSLVSFTWKNIKIYANIYMYILLFGQQIQAIWIDFVIRL